MEWICFWELSDLGKSGVVGGVAVGSLLFVLGVILAFRPGLWKGTGTEFTRENISLRAPAPLACMVLGVIAIAGAGGWLWKSFPANNFSFSQKRWTLGEIKERLESESKIRVELRGDAASFTIDKEFSGACSSDLLISICKFYPSKLQCDRPKSGSFIIALRP